MGWASIDRFNFVCLAESSVSRPAWQVPPDGLVKGSSVTVHHEPGHRTSNFFLGSQARSMP